MTVKGGTIIGGGFLPNQEYTVKVYDFKRPDKFSKDQIRTVAIMHESFARLAATAFSTSLRSMVDVHVSSVDQLTYQEFIRSIAGPTTFPIVGMDPLRGSAVMEIEPSLAFAAIDRLLGGAGESEDIQRELTEIEQGVIEGLILRILASLRESWSAVIDLRPRLRAIETNPQFAQIVPPTEMIVLVTLEAAIGGRKGRINLCLPYLTIEPIIPKLSARYWYSRGSDEAGRMGSRLASLAVPARLHLEARPLSLRDLSGLKKNDLIRLADVKRARLVAGDSTVLRLRAVGGRDRPAGELAVETEGQGETRDLQFLSPGAQEARPHTLLANAIGQLRGELAAPLEALKDSLNGLAGRQEEMLDHLVFAATEPDHRVAPAGGKPFAFIRAADLGFLATFLPHEHAQTVAMILSYLETDLASSVLSRLPEQQRVPVVERIASMDSVAPAVLKKVEEVLEDRLKMAATEELFAAGGVGKAAEILNLSTRSLEKQVIESLGEKNPALAEAIKLDMFVFEDIVLLEPKAVQTVLKNVEQRDLVLSLKAADEQVRRYLLDSLSEAESKQAQRALAQTGRVRLGDVEAAQQRIVNIIRTLEESGAILVARPDEPTVD